MMVSALFFLSLVAKGGDPIAGEWTGLSLCQVRPSPCNDERAYYRITVTADQGYKVELGKIDKFTPEFFGALDDVAYDTRHKRLTGTTKDRIGRTARWEFKVRRNHMSGQVINPDGTIYRKIELDRP
jgi:hypothetical protein